MRIPAIAVHHYRVFAQSCSRLSRSPVHADCRSLQSRSRVCSHHRTSVRSCRRVSSTLIYLMAQKMMKSADRGDVVSRLPYGSEHRRGRHHRRCRTVLQERNGPSVPAMWQRPDSCLGHEDLSKVSGPDAIHRRKRVLDLRCQNIPLVPMVFPVRHSPFQEISSDLCTFFPHLACLFGNNPYLCKKITAIIIMAIIISDYVVL